MMAVLLRLDPLTASWLQRESDFLCQEPAALVLELLRELANLNQFEGDLIDRILAETGHHFPPVMTLEELVELKNELLDDLCRRLTSKYRDLLGEPMPLYEQARIRGRLERQSQLHWG